MFSFLTKRDFRNCWRPTADVANFSDASTFLKRQLQSTDLVDSNIAQEVKFAESTWTSFATTLTKAQDKLGGGSVVEARIIGDFLSDLHLRGLVK